MTRPGYFPRLAAIVTILALVAGCSLAPGTRKPSSIEFRPLLPSFSAEPRKEEPGTPPIIPITAELVATQKAARLQDQAGGAAMPPSASANAEYVIGPGDVLAVTVWDHPELTIPAGEFRAAEIAGSLVDAAGMIYYPYVGQLKVAGLTIPEVRTRLTEELSRNIRNPQVDLRVAAFRSKKILITGEVKTPNVIPLTDRPITLLEAINLAGGTTPAADLRNVRLNRDKKIFHLDLLAIYRDGIREPVIMQPDDQVHVPDNIDNTVYVLGEVAEPALVPMVHRQLSLADALGRAGGINEDAADAGQVYVIRGQLDRPLVFRLDATNADALLLATAFDLEKHDVVYVAPTGLTVWNRIVRQILPTVQTLWQTRAIIRSGD